MDKLNLGKVLGKGIFATVYEIDNNGKKYICKIQKQPKDIKNLDTRESLWREIEFNKFAVKHPDRFLILRSYKIIDDCKYKPPKTPKWMTNKEVISKIKRVEKSQCCSALVYSPLLDATLEDFYKSEFKNISKLVGSKSLLTDNMVSMICQVLYSLDLLYLDGYIHGDISNDKNIMYKKCDEQYIKLGKVKIPTYGKQWYLIDYGNVISDRFKLNDNEKKLIKLPLLNVAQFIFNTLYFPINAIIIRDKLKINSFEKIIEKCKKRQEYESILKLLPPIDESMTLKYCFIIIYALYFPAEFHMLLGIDIIKYRKYIIQFNKSYQTFYTRIVCNIDQIPEVIKIISETHNFS